MTTLFHTVVTSKRHKEIGMCESSDFAKLELLELSLLEKNLIVSFVDYDKKIEFIEHGGLVFQKIGNGKDFINGRFSRQRAVKYILELRQQLEEIFSGVYDKSFILIGNTLYEQYCIIEKLGVTVCGNTLFSHWIHIDIESHFGKDNLGLGKSILNSVVKERRKRWNDSKPKTTRGDGHSCFSFPKKVKWGEKYK